jgi:hypothetical protein
MAAPLAQAGSYFLISTFQYSVVGAVKAQEVKKTPTTT